MEPVHRLVIRKVVVSMPALQATHGALVPLHSSVEQVDAIG